MAADKHVTQIPHTPNSVELDASNLRTLLIERAGHSWIVHWEPGDERMVMEWAIELADQDLSGFTAADARIVAEAVSESLHRSYRPQHTPPNAGT